MVSVIQSVKALNAVQNYVHLSRSEVELSELTFFKNGTPKVDWQDVIVWNHGRLCVRVLFVLVSRGFIGTSGATADL